MKKAQLFGAEKLPDQITEEQRREVALALRQEGHSYRAIGGALGTSEATVRRDVVAATASGDAVDLPSVVTGLDGKVRAARKPRLPARLA